MRKYFAVLIALAFSGCMTQTVNIKLTPSEPDIQWIDGIGMIDKNDRGIYLQVGYVEINDDMLSFYVIIRNESGKNIEIEPTKFECIHESEAGRSSAFAKDPEKQIRQLENEISRENESYQNAGLADFVVDIFSLALMIGSIGREKTDEEIEFQQQAEDNQLRRADQENEHFEKLASLEDQKAFWEANALRKTTLSGDEEIRGSIFFPIQSKTGNLRLRFPIDDVSLEALYNQKITER